MNMNIARLRTLSNHLRRNVRNAEWNYCDWDSCALAHACRIPEFAAAGLHTSLIAREKPVPAFVQCGELLYACHAACAFFGLTMKQAVSLFCTSGSTRNPDNKPDVDEIADRIDDIVFKELHANELEAAVYRAFDQTQAEAVPA